MVWTGRAEMRSCREVREYVFKSTALDSRGDRVVPHWHGHDLLRAFPQETAGLCTQPKRGPSRVVKGVIKAFTTYRPGRIGWPLWNGCQGDSDRHRVQIL